MENKKNIFTHLSKDIPSGIVVFLVALPLCLGIAMASGAPLFAGIIGGIIGGIVIGTLSNSHVSVSGPAAGLAAIVLAAISTLGKFEVFLVAVVLAGIFQIILGLIKAGSIADYFPSSVVEGMLAGIGIIIFMKQLPHAFGYDKDTEGDLTFFEKDGSNTFQSLINMFDNIHPGATIISIVGVLILLIWDKVPFLKKLKVLPGALIVVASGILIDAFFMGSGMTNLAVLENHLVRLPVINSFSELNSVLVFPDFSYLTDKKVWIVAATIAVVASLETLLCIEASDKMDPYKRFTNQNRELLAQGTGNILSGLLGGLPLTSVVVRTTANISAGNQTKISSIIHGVVLLLCVILIPALLNKIPLASLAAILLLIGYKLANPAKIMAFYKEGRSQFIPFIITLLAVVFTDLLTGVGIGLVISMIFVLVVHTKNNYFISKNQLANSREVNIKLSEEVSFLHKPAIKQTFVNLPSDVTLNIDARECKYIAYDILEIINNFKNTTAPDRNITVNILGMKEKYSLNDLDSVEVINK